MDLLNTLTGFFLGVRHSLEADHVTAVAQFASSDPRPRRGLVFGLLWGAGHSAALLLLAAGMALLGLRLDRRFERFGEIAVGVMLIVLAAWRLLRLYTREHEHLHVHGGGLVHSHPHRHGLGHLHAHGPTAIGFVHGTAGALGVLALLPLSDTPARGLVSVAAFGLGSLMAMGLFGALAARFYGTMADARRHAVYRAAVLATGLSGLTLGLLWIARNV